MFLLLYRNAGLGNGIHCLQVQIAMRGTFVGKYILGILCDCIPLCLIGSEELLF